MTDVDLSSLSIMETLAPKPPRGKAGKPVKLRANYFQFKTDGSLITYLYDVSMTDVPEQGQETREIDNSGFRRAIMDRLKTTHQDFNGLMPAFDGSKLMYLTKDLCTELKERHYVVEMPPDPNNPRRRNRDPQNFNVRIKRVNTIDRALVNQYLQAPGERPFPADVIQHFEVVLRECMAGRRDMKLDKRGYYMNPHGADVDVTRGQINRDVELGGGLEMWSGFANHVRATELDLCLNFDLSFRVFNQPINVIDFVMARLNLRGPDEFPRHVHKIKSLLKNMRVIPGHTQTRENKVVLGLSDRPPQQIEFELRRENRKVNVLQYYSEAYNYRLKLPNIPCLDVGRAGRPAYVPMEVCWVAPGQRYNSKKFDATQTQNMITFTKRQPEQRRQATMQGLRNAQYDKNDLLRHFRIGVGTEMMPVQGRILPTPVLQYGSHGRITTVTPRSGEWNLKDTQVYSGRTLERWAVMSFASDRFLNQQAIRNFVNTFRDMARRTGMQNVSEPLGMAIVDPRQMEDRLKWASGQNLQLLVVVLPRKEIEFYQRVKYLGDTKAGFPTQCLVANNVKKANPQYCANVVMKVNAKVGGTTVILKDTLPKFDVPTCVFGIDVAHAAARKDSPSVAAVVASCDRFASRFVSRTTIQRSGLEIVERMAESVKECLEAFKQRMNTAPQRLIFYRDGVSEGQYMQVANAEVEAIRKACSDLHPSYKPGITFVVVQKRHHMRMFAEDKSGTDRSGNCLAGTIIDHSVVDPSRFEFYLISQAGLQGTSRPSKYTVLVDDNGFTADQFQTMTNSMCYTFCRCTRSVSVCPPAYYAHLVAFRARSYLVNAGIDDSSSETASMMSGGMGAPARGQALPPQAVAQPHKNLFNVMYFV
eukprot:Rmarinus@m.20463